ncbi:hypothetical protein B0H14DRAFT_2576036 [Mycena olivaceomarginata]|nr:hypothetical protein B0H14DRAFT_2576036 [Mycena olivaceomarginata]
MLVEACAGKVGFGNGSSEALEEGQRERKGIDCLRYLTGLRCTNVLDRLEELEATFEGFGDVLKGKTGLKGFEIASESLGDLKVRAREASSEGCGGMAVRGLWGSDAMGVKRKECLII